MSEDKYINELAAQAVTQLKGVGPKVAERLGHLGIHNVEDLLFHLPHRYQDRTRVSSIAQLRPEHYVVVEGRSEEHTSELQSRGHLVCRLLLEKKKERK